MPDHPSSRLLHSEGACERQGGPPDCWPRLLLWPLLEFAHRFGIGRPIRLVRSAMNPWWRLASSYSVERHECPQNRKPDCRFFRALVIRAARTR